VKEYNTTSPMMRNSHLCALLSPLKLNRVDQEDQLAQRILCDYQAPTPGKPLPSVRVPFPIQLVVSASARNSLANLVLGYSMQACGGVFILEPGDNMTLRQPSGMEAIQGAIDCAWAIGPYVDASGDDEVEPQDIQLEVTLHDVNLPTPSPAAGSTELPCLHHYLKVRMHENSFKCHS